MIELDHNEKRKGFKEENTRFFSRRRISVSYNFLPFQTVYKEIYIDILIIFVCEKNWGENRKKYVVNSW
ncbi:MAG: hypothetical protein Devi2KO_39870 [Devosia indica]